MVGSILDRDTLVPVGYLDVVNPYVGAGHVDTVKSSFVASADDGVVYLAISTLLEE